MQSVPRLKEGASTSLSLTTTSLSLTTNSIRMTLTSLSQISPSPPMTDCGFYRKSCQSEGKFVSVRAESRTVILNALKWGFDFAQPDNDFAQPDIRLCSA